MLLGFTRIYFFLYFTDPGMLYDVYEESSVYLALFYKMNSKYVNIECFKILSLFFDHMTQKAGYNLHNME
jgi:hypothetical protein